MNRILTFDISKLLDAQVGTRDNYTIEGKVKIEDLVLKSELKAKVEIMRIETGFNVKVSGLEVDVELPCDRCLENYAQLVKIRSTDRIFYMDKPTDFEDTTDPFLVDKKHLAVNIDEFLRQEIILHFPVTYVCSSGCKGLCKTCGKNKNLKGKCKCKEEVIDEAYRPLSKLKELLK